jgi:release factor glutamine methyltransferase
VTTAEALAAGVAYLGAHGVDSPRLDTELILARALGLSRLELYTGHDRPLSSAERDRARELLTRRGAREPLAYVLGDWGFRRLRLLTDSRALVPRPETEVVVERALALIAGQTAPRVVDVGTGSGAIALAIATEHPGAIVTATDVSVAALALAGENAAALEVEIELVHTNLLESLTGPFDLVVSNPPYVRADEIAGLQPEVRDWEPRQALLAEQQTEELAGSARGVLVPGGAIVLETHAEGAQAVAAGLARLGYEPAQVTRDLAGRDRVVEARWPRAT